MDHLAANLRTDWAPIIVDRLRAHAPKIDDEIEKDILKHEGTLDLLPPSALIFDAFAHFDVADLRVVVLGQDCYPTKGDAMGLCFSVPSTRRCAPSLRNVFKELEREYGKRRENTDLTDWAKQGVLLLNTALTVREGSAGSHLKLWKDFTRSVVREISARTQRVAYLLWGAHAQSYEIEIDASRNLILKCVHPSPLAARSGSFVGCGHFRAANEYLSKFDRGTIEWI